MIYIIPVPVTYNPTFLNFTLNKQSTCMNIEVNVLELNCFNMYIFDSVKHGKW